MVKGARRQDVYTVENDGVQYLRVVVDRLAGGTPACRSRTCRTTCVQIGRAMRAGTGDRRQPRIPIVLRRGPDAVKVSPPAEFAALRITTPGRQRAAGSAWPGWARKRPSEDRPRDGQPLWRGDRQRHRPRSGGFRRRGQGQVARREAATGYRCLGGQFENQQRAAARWSGRASCAGPDLLILFSTFGSVRQALLVLSNIPFALVGGIVGAVVDAGEYLSVPASVGFIALLGIAVLNGVVLVTYFNQLHAEAACRSSSAVVEGARSRLRPVLMTPSCCPSFT